MTGVALDHLLTHGAREATLGELAEVFRMDEIALVLPGMAAFASSSSLGNKLRGALGDVLLDSASTAVRARAPCDWPHTSTAEIFFGRRPLIRLGDHSSEIAKPFVFEARGRSDGGLSILLRIFGLARGRTDAVADALIVAVQERVRWGDLAKDGPRFLPRHVEPESVEVATNLALDVHPLPPSAVELVFLTPIDADRGDAARAPTVLLDRILRRVALLAPWCGNSLATAFADVGEAMRGLDVESFEATSAPAAGLGGHHFENRLSPPMRMRLSGSLQPIWPALAICELAHVGRGASLGLGWYRTARL